MDDHEDTLVYSVVVNHEEQYSVWPVHKPIPAGWQAVGKTGKKVFTCPRMMLVVTFTERVLGTH